MIGRARRNTTRPARYLGVVVVSLGGLLVVLIAGVIASLLITQRVHDVAEQALSYDVALGEQGDDLRAAVLDLRHHQRNILFAGPSRGGVESYELAYTQLHAEIDRYELLDIDGLPIATAQQLRDHAEAYYAIFRPAVDLYDTNQDAFIEANDEGLIVIDQLEDLALDIDRFGEERTSKALTNVERASRTATLDVLTVLAGLIALGLLLAVLVAHTANDIRRLYSEQQAAAIDLERALQAKNDFIADASHELRTPLTVLRGNAEVGLTLDRVCVHTPILEEIVRESERMTRLVEDLLFLARSDSHAAPLRTRRIAAAELLDGLREPAEILVQQHGSTLESSLNGDGLLDIDVERIEQAVMTLLDNAGKYAAGGGPITLGVARQDGQIAISVRDHGPGIPEAELDHIFERFYRVDKTRSRKLGGAGLGLAIARSIVDAHGGRVVASSRVNEGTTMTLYLPIADGDGEHDIDRG